MADLGKVMIIPRGEYSSDADYERLDLVTCKGSSYVALKDVTGVEPSDDGVNWQLHGRGYTGDISDTTVVDTYNLLSAGAGTEADGQSFLDKLADMVANKLVAKAALVNNATATEAGVSALDAVMGKTLQDQITQLNSEMVIGIPTIRIKLSDDNETGVRKLIITNREETVWYGNIAIDAKGDGVL